MRRIWLLIAGLSGLSSVSAGALAAHIAADERAAELLRTGALYGIVHAVALLALGRQAAFDGLALRAAGWAFAIGVMLFSWSLFVLALTGQAWVARVTPFGGVTLMVGWIAVIAAALRGTRGK